MSEFTKSVDVISHHRPPDKTQWAEDGKLVKKLRTTWCYWESVCANRHELLFIFPDFSPSTVYAYKLTYNLRPFT